MGRPGEKEGEGCSWVEREGVKWFGGFLFFF
jgi:hypothetical protein